MAKWSQFHNWVLVATIVDFGNDLSFEIKSIVWTPSIELILGTYVVREIALHTRIMHLGSNHWSKAFAEKKFLQINNCVKDNNNRHLLAFLSLLMARDVFEVKVGFLVVGHTHEDINGCFGYLSKKLKDENNYILVDLMRAFMISNKRSFIPQLIQEILDFKS